MITPELLQHLRCPLDPQRLTGLILEDDVKVLCERCRLQFKTRDGIVNLIVEDAVLPAMCDRLGDLPCQKKK